MIVENLGNGKLINADNLEAMKAYDDNTFDSCISDFPYDLAFMGRKWDSYENFYGWCKDRAEGLYRIIKHGGYVLIFGHHKTNHRMKCAFEDVGFKIVEEIDWVYGSGFPKNQDVGKLFSKANNTELSKKWNGWKTAGLKPAKEIITVFQKPMIGKYTDNIRQFCCGGMNIDSCRVEFSSNDDPRIGKGYKHNAKAGYEIGKNKDNQSGEKLSLHNELGRFPANIIFDTYMGLELDKQSGTMKSRKGKPRVANINNNVRLNNSKQVQVNCEYEGGASRFFLSVDEEFLPFIYCSKPTKKEKGDYCSHITVKPKKLIKWLIKLVTPKDGLTLDITAGSGTHGLSCEELNREEGYNLKWVDIELLNTEKEPYFDIAKKRIGDYTSNKCIKV